MFCDFWLLDINNLKEKMSVCFCIGSEELWSEADSSCSGQPIHLWQFLRELLLKPHNYGRYIRWLNKEKGAIPHLLAFLIVVF